MSTRSYSGTLIFENVFDAIPASNMFLRAVADNVFSPRVEIVEDDCGTLLGEVTTLSFDSEGAISVVTGARIDRPYIQDQLAQGIYEIQVRSLSSCISEGGVCKTCYEASKPASTVPGVGSFVRIPPEFQMQSEVVSIKAGSSSCQLSFSSDIYDNAYPFRNGVILDTSTYAISNNVLTLNSPVSEDTFITVKYSVISRAPFFYWLAKTYGGSLLGLKSLPIRPLTLKPSLFSSLIPDVDVESLIERINANPSIPEDVTMYLPDVTSKMEKALLAIAVDSIFSNISN